MIKNTIVLVICLLSVNQLLAQYLVGPRLNYGLSQFSYDKQNTTEDNSKFANVYGIGGIYNFEVTPKYSLHLEANFEKRVKKTNEITYNNWHIEVPALLRLSFKAKNKLMGAHRMYVNAGPYIGYWLRGKANLNFTDNDSTIDTTVDVKFSGSSEGNLRVNSANRVQYGLAAGFGFMIPTLQDQYFMLDFRYYLGGSFIADDAIFESGNVEFNDSLRGNYQVISVSVAYLFNIDVIPSKKGKSTIKRRR
ncbi:PorT family protein [Fulvivirga sp. RKSG066]|uniref:porin family protein n=1 Tax=Fulvivirga aurantia TaxID=2529383 RepID=UPI0012BBFB80|nr:porin family protein [Fulvivirga aurantia]MTI21584.1 PorT family protein [Fulvivirga aurantia]